MRRSLTLAALTGLLAIASPALAHVTVQPNEALVGAFARFAVRVPNERPDASTTRIQVRFPEVLVFVSFEDAPGWQRQVKMKKLDEPVEVFGNEITEVVDSVTWSGGRVEPGEFTEFGFSARLPEQETTLEFPALQTYSSGEVVRWIGPADSEEPAARVSVLDVGAEEGQGQLAVLAALARRSDEGEAARDDGEDEGGSLLPWAGIVLGGAALAISLTGRRRA